MYKNIFFNLIILIFLLFSPFLAFTDNGEENTDTSEKDKPLYNDTTDESSEEIAPENPNIDSIIEVEEGDEGLLFDLFDEPTEDFVVKDTDVDHRKQVEQNEQMIIKRSFSAQGGGSIGWIGFPQFDDLSDGFDVALGSSAKALLSFSAKPDPIFGVSGTFYTEIDYDNGKTDWSQLVIDQLYGDYILLDKAFFRVGKFPMKWGQGRIFTPGDLMDESEDGVSVRAAFPTVMDGLTLVTLANKYYQNNRKKQFGEHDLVAGGLIDKVFGNLYLSLGTRYQYYAGWNFLGSLKIVLFKIDFFTDMVLLENKTEDDYDFETVAGFFREWDKFKIYGEYSYEKVHEISTNEYEYGHNVGLAAGYKKIFSTSIDFAVEWRHTFYDNSGRVIPAISFYPWKFVRMNFGVPILYGDDTSRKILDDDDEYDYIQENRGIYFVFSIKLSSSF